MKEHNLPTTVEPQQEPVYIDYTLNDSYNELMRSMLTQMGEVNEKMAESRYQQEIDDLYKDYLKKAKTALPEQLKLMGRFNKNLNENIKESSNFVSRGGWKLLQKGVNASVSALDELTDIPVLKQVKTAARFVRDTRLEHKNEGLNAKQKALASTMTNNAVNQYTPPTAQFTPVSDKLKEAADPTATIRQPTEVKPEPVNENKQLVNIDKNLTTMQQDVQSLRESAEFRTLFMISGALLKPLLALIGGLGIGKLVGLLKGGKTGKSVVNALAKKCCCSEFDTPDKDKKRKKSKSKKSKSKSRSKSKVKNAKKSMFSKVSEFFTDDEPKKRKKKPKFKPTPKTAAKATGGSVAAKLAKSGGGKLLTKLAMGVGGAIVGGAAVPMIAVGGALLTAYEVGDLLGVNDWVGDKISGLMADKPPAIKVKPTTGTLSAAATPMVSKPLQTATAVDAEAKRVETIEDIATGGSAAAPPAAAIQPVITNVSNNSNTSMIGSIFSFDNSRYTSQYDKGTFIVR